MITFIVPARSGSQRLPNKNILPLNGRPLIFYTIDALLNHELIDRVIFTSDSEDYCQLVENEYGQKITTLLRPKETATNTTKVVEELRRIINNHPSLFSSKWFGLALPTAPLRNYNTVLRCLEYFKKVEKPIFSCNEYDFPIQFAFNFNASHKNTNWNPISKESPMITGNTRSQDIKKTYRPNGAIYINSIDNFLNVETLYKNAYAFEISAEESIDIDNEIDFKIAEFFLNE
jgi:CMP-N,N'-diacetyllegionaminic acid synthase